MGIQMDFIVAVVVFFSAFLLIVNTTNNYFSGSMEEMNIDLLRDNSAFLMESLTNPRSELSIVQTQVKTGSIEQQGDENILWPSYEVQVVDMGAVSLLQSEDYTLLKEEYDLQDFHITLEGVMDMGAKVPEEGDVVSMINRVWYRDGLDIVSKNLVVYSW